MAKILIVEDDPGIRKILDMFLSNAGYELRFEKSGERALDTFLDWKPSLVLLDVMLPGRDGWSILRSIRSRSSCPVIMLTALNEAQDRLEGLDGGADDYMGKPFSGEEVVARVRAILRRPSFIVDEKTAVFGSLKVDFAGRTVLLNDEIIKLMPRDLLLLLFLARHPNQTFDREQLIERVWGKDYEGSNRAVDLAVKRLRDALAGWPAEEGEIQTVRGVGYRLQCP